jgi:hypothetical protein
VRFISVTIPRQSRGLSNCEPLKGAKTAACAALMFFYKSTIAATCHLFITLERRISIPLSVSQTQNKKLICSDLRSLHTTAPIKT